MNKTLREIVFPFGPNTAFASDGILLILRLMSGGLMAVHGVQKIMAFEALSTAFPDPIGLGSQTSVILAIFAELLCSLAVIGGLLFRLALLPLIFTMCVAVSVMWPGGFNALELPLLYLLIFALMLVTGPGRFSMDYCLYKRFRL